MNYDGTAISEAAARLRRETTGDRRVLIVVSDGTPSGEDGVNLARQAVERSRRDGIEVIGVAIEAYQAEAIYGASHTLKFTDLSTLIGDFKRLLRRIYR